MNIYVIAIALLSIINTVNAAEGEYEWRDKTRSDTAACVGKEISNEYWGMKFSGDQEGQSTYLQKKLCVIMPGGTKVKVLTGDYDKAEVALYSGKNQGKMSWWIISTQVLK